MSAKTSLFYLQYSLVRKTVIARFGDDDVVKHIYLHDLASLVHLLCKADICSAGLQISGRMIVREDNGRSKELDRFLENDLYISNRACYSAFADRFHS